MKNFLNLLIGLGLIGIIIETMGTVLPAFSQGFWIFLCFLAVNGRNPLEISV